MKLVLIHGQNHKGNTYMVADQLAKKIGGERKDFFLPRDFDQPCTGCLCCFSHDMTACPHYEKLRPITEAMDAADVIILDSPVYVLHATGQMMAFLDHYGTRWMVHRPDERAFRKQGVVISTAGGGGMKSTNKGMYHSLLFWGVPKIYQMGFGVRATSPEGVPDRIRKKMDKKIDQVARKISRRRPPFQPNCKAWMLFYAIRFAHLHLGQSEPDYSYWEKRGWHGRRRPWK